MPGSGSDETGVKYLARQFSDYNAGVPIKKRKIPKFWLPSPPREEQSSLTSANKKNQSDLTSGNEKEQSTLTSGNEKEQSTLTSGNKKEQSSITSAYEKEVSGQYQGPGSTSASVSASSGLSDVNNSMPSKEGGDRSTVTNINTQHSNSELSRVKVEEPTLTFNSVSSSAVNNIKKPVDAHSSSNSQHVDVFRLGEGTSTKAQSEERFKSEVSAVTKNTELSLGLREHLVPSAAGENVEGCCKGQENIGSVSLDLSLSKGECGTGAGSTTDGGHLPPNRSNWDLNTTMDAWEGTKHDFSLVEKINDGLGTKNDINLGEKIRDGVGARGNTQDTKPLVRSTGMVSDNVALLNRVKQNEKGNNSPMLPPKSGQILTSENTLHLGLGPSFIQHNVIQKPLSSSRERGSSITSNIAFPWSAVASGNRTIVKSEPIDECFRQNFKGCETTPMGFIDIRAVKREILEKISLDAKSSNISTAKLIASASIKSETVSENTHERPKTVGCLSSQSDKPVKEMPVQLEKLKQVMSAHSDKQIPALSSNTASGFLSAPNLCLKTDSIARDEVANKSEHPTSYGEAKCNSDVLGEVYETHGQSAPETVSLSSRREHNDSNVSGMDNTKKDENNPPSKTEHRRLKCENEPVVNGEGSGSDEEKVNISGDMLEEDSYGSDCDSDGNHGVTGVMGREENAGEDDDFEDGEVRESEQCAITDGPKCDISGVQRPRFVNSGKQGKHFAGSSKNELNSLHSLERETKLENLAGDHDHDGKIVNMALEKTCDVAAKDACIQLSSADEVPKTNCDVKKLNEGTLQGNSAEKSAGRDHPNAEETEKSYDEVGIVSHGAARNVLQRGNESVESDLGNRNGLALAKEEVTLNGNDAGKSDTPGVSRGRIIKLTPSSTASPPGKTAFLSARPLRPPKRERLSDTAMDVDRLRPRGRGEVYMSRERHQDDTYRSSRTNFVHSRGRISSRIDKVHDHWDSERNVVPDYYNAQTDFRVARHKYASAVADGEIDYNYKMVSDGAFAGSEWGGRKLITNEAPLMHHLPSKRRSPGARDGPGGRSFHMVRRFPRNISPSRCIGDDGSEIVGMRHGPKLLRRCPDDDVDPLLTRPQAPFQGVGDHFVRGSRNFSSVRRRCPPQIRSRSPIRSRSRSPRPWCSPRRRSPGGFGGPPDLPHRRSPVYRMERLRSPGGPCFQRDINARRHGSPAYMSRSSDLRDEHGHPRSVIHNRSPPGRVLFRNNRRVDIVNSRERTDCEEYFGEPVHSDRFQELGGESNGDERRFSERRGPPYRRKYHH